MDTNLFQDKILSGTELATIMKDSIKERLCYLYSKYDWLMKPTIKIIQIGDKTDSIIYVNNIIKSCFELGLESDFKNFKNDVTENELINEIQIANSDKTIYGIIVQLPLPDHFDKKEILSKINLMKDVDGLNLINLSLDNQLNLENKFLSSTAIAVLEILRLALEFKNDINRYKNEYIIKNIFTYKLINLQGKNIVVIGRGLTAGLPIFLLMQKCNGTVTLCHSKTDNLNDKCLNADIIISAVGRKELITHDMVKRDSILVDVGINVLDKGICGDIDFDNIIEKSKYITPVPGGVGKMTVVMLLRNVIMSWGSMNMIDI
jgi:methylenetetrahydrofolate dehydrogenase (NADP+)/methenyltetrahydrofolate cyclohydrolase